MFATRTGGPEPAHSAAFRTVVPVVGRRLARRPAAAFFVALGLAALLLCPHPALAAGGSVGSGTAASCTESAFDATWQAVQSSGGGVITFSCGAAPATILFSTQKAVSAATELRGAGLITLSGGNARSLFQVYSGQTLTLDGMTLTRAYGTAGAVESFGRLVIRNSQLTGNTSTASGGAIASYGELSVTDSTFSGNSAAQTGGAVFLDGGSAAINGSRFTDNTAADAGGAIRATVVTSMTVNAGQFSGNKVTATFAQGGAIRSEGTALITGSAFATNNGSRGGALSVGDGSATVTETSMTANWAAYGGAIRQEGGSMTLGDTALSGNGYAPNGSKITTGGGGVSWGAGTARLTNVLISGNWASYGGGFDHTSGTAELTNVTISGNAAVGSGGFDMDGGSVALTNVTIADNSAQFNAAGIARRGGALTVKNALLSTNLKTGTQQGWNCNAALVGPVFSLSSDFTCALGPGRDGVSIGLRPLASNGGFSQTQLLAKGSPAVDAGTGLGCPATDQRGVARPQGAACDVGAVEMRAADYLVRMYLPLTLR